MSNRRKLVIIALILFFGALALWFRQTLRPTVGTTSPDREVASLSLPDPSMLPAEPVPSGKTIPTAQPSKSPSDSETNSDFETPVAQHKSRKTQSKTKKSNGFQMETVAVNSAIDETVVEDLSSDGYAPETSKTKGSASLPTKTKSKDVTELDAMMEDAILIVHGFTETYTDEISGVWRGTLTGKSGGGGIVLNRIWDDMTDDYLPTSCFGFEKSGTLTSTYLRRHNLKFYEKNLGKKSKLIVVVKDKYIFEILSPKGSQRRITGKAYTTNNKKLTPMGTLVLNRDDDATADTDCETLD